MKIISSNKILHIYLKNSQGPNIYNKLYQQSYKVLNLFTVNMNSELFCSICKNQYSKVNPPRILRRCSHTFCQECIKITRFCPIDKYLVDFKRYTLQGFAINQQILSEIQYSESIQQKKIVPQQQQQQQMCLLHNKKLELVCIQDGVKICANCGLFGEHKLHKIKTIENIKQEFLKVAFQTNSVFEKLAVLEETVGSEIIESLIDQSFKQKRDVLAKAIKTKYTKLIERIRKIQKNSILKLDKLFTDEKQTLYKVLDIQQINDKKRNWILEASIVSDLAKLELEKVQTISRYLDESFHENGVAKRGQYLIVQLNYFENMLKQNIQKYSNNISYEVNAQIDQKIQNYIKLFNQKQKQKINEIQKDNQDLLLPTQSFLVPSKQIVYDSNQCLTQREQYNIRETLSLGLESLNFANNISEIQCITDCRASKIVIQDQTTISSSQKTIVMNEISQTQLSSLTQNKKKKKTKIPIPEKYEQIVNDLRNDKCEVIDLGGAELGDQIVLLLCEEITHSVKIKQLKLIRNKLTDQSLLGILTACKDTNIASLNLSQNLLTDKALQILMNNPLKNLKTITLSQNKINLRNCKNKINDFKKNGVTISI